MSIIDFKAMKKDKELFDNMADRLIKDTLNKKKEYATLYNKANMLKNEINLILIDFRKTAYEAGLKIDRNINDYSFSELEDLLVDTNIANKYLEKLKIYVYKIKLRLNEINQMRTNMIQLDLYENHMNGMEDDTLDEEYIDMDKIRAERGIEFNDEVEAVTSVLQKFNYDSLTSTTDEYFDHICDGTITIKDIAREMYGSPSYWVYIYTFDNNEDIINKILLSNHINIDEFVSNPEYIKGINLKLPKEIEFYSDEFNTTTLKKIS